MVKVIEERLPKYRALLDQYLQPPTLGTDSPQVRRTVDHELGQLEDALLDSPAWYEDDHGQRHQFRPGLITSEQVRAEAVDKDHLDFLHELAQVPVPQFRESGIKLITPDELDEVIRKRKADRAMNRDHIRFTLDQNGYGSCASEGVSGITMGLNVIAGAELVKLNPYALYCYVNGGRDGGSSLSDNISAILKYGVPPQSLWPRSKGIYKRPDGKAAEEALRYKPQEYYRINTGSTMAQEIWTANLYGFLVYFGYPGHAIFMVDPIDRSRGLYKNSWGNWGDDGFGTIRYTSIEQGYGVWAFCNARRTV